MHVVNSITLGIYFYNISEHQQNAMIEECTSDKSAVSRSLSLSPAIYLAIVLHITQALIFKQLFISREVKSLILCALNLSLND